MCQSPLLWPRLLPKQTAVSTKTSDCRRPLPIITLAQATRPMCTPCLPLPFSHPNDYIHMAWMQEISPLVSCFENSLMPRCRTMSGNAQVKTKMAESWMAHTKGALAYECFDNLAGCTVPQLFHQSHAYKMFRSANALLLVERLVASKNGDCALQKQPW